MRIRIEVETEGQVFSIEQDNRLAGYSSVGPVGIGMFAECVGRMLATMSVGSDVPMDVIVASFTKTITLTARPMKSEMDDHVD